MTRVGRNSKLNGTPTMAGFAVLGIAKARSQRRLVPVQKPSPLSPTRGRGLGRGGSKSEPYHFLVRPRFQGTGCFWTETS